MDNNGHRFTVAGTDIEEVKRKNAEAGMSYKEVLQLLAKTGGHNTKQYSNTKVEEVKKKIYPYN
ncbi:gamma-type small acid-soluble spore protein [Lysinibacillus halotolerans]|uniref:Gamma-type small acid-soluble spore protein n=2 Tax=Bacillales TaxID=1385 RepID=A0A3M8HBP5_9BACI|nr:gamma-type small acid-soluble spore protein [Lysinibacillus halotolerans]RNC99792.1 gamma-type small acid-soluble spore protein [Lysinibacillus halotolerans]